MQEIILKNNIKIPILNSRIYKILAEAKFKKTIKNVINISYRMIDVVQTCKNKESIGNTIINSEIYKKELFIVNNKIRKSIELKLFAICGLYEKLVTGPRKCEY